MPTEAEWEFAYRAGTTTGLYNNQEVGWHYQDPDVDLIGWYGANEGSYTHPPKGKAPNPWGLYDMAGNVAESVWDTFAYYPGTAVTDPLGAPDVGNPAASYRMFRGGGYSDWASHLRAAYRNWGTTPDQISTDRGFRLSRTTP